jgi:hypothetical protein
MKVSLAAQVMSLTVAEAINTLGTVGKDNCTELEQYIGLSVVMLCGATIMYLFSFMELSCHEGNSHCSNITAGYMDSRCLSTAAFLKEIDSFFDSLMVSHTTLTILRFCVAD